MNKEDCKGCIVYERDLRFCSWFHKDLICPCSICLVKAMCEDMCEEITVYLKIKEKCNGRI